MTTKLTPARQQYQIAYRTARIARRNPTLANWYEFRSKTVTDWLYFNITRNHLRNRVRELETARLHLDEYADYYIRNSDEQELRDMFYNFYRMCGVIYIEAVRNG